LPQRRLTCSIERRQNPELFTALFDSLFLMTQPNVPGLDAMVARIGV